MDPPAQIVPAMKGDDRRERFVGTIFQNDIATIWGASKVRIYKRYLKIDAGCFEHNISN